ncbi:Phage tail-collar fibre protein [Pseudomonas extremaustralis]|uniref:phage tail-collar fiber domain-containing protein n=1 Tax=Pseudomonas extremaustralis TaxID=359110 RepID=UPI00099B6980|nr:phage tail protein [Pseudomonas extremaustralis]SKB00405.1 Phage tail-collar fibre protein [Pseudomonas extremaustralis]
MGASITLAGENLIAQKQAANAGLKVSRFIFANVPGLNPNAPVDRAASKPSAGQIVYVHDIAAEHAGYVNPNQVVYSAQIGSDIGDWDFNWIGLETTEGVLFAVAYVPVQQKRRNIPPLQIGNNLTRNFLVAFDGALALTGITIDASTWQHDFTVRLAGIDERERLSNRDVYGRACFFGSSLQMEKAGSTYQLKPGTAYVEGIRLVQSAALPVVPPALPAKAWLDVVLQRELSDVVASWTVVFGSEKADYTDALGVKHYCVAIADLAVASVTDRRPVEAIDGPLVQQFALRTGDYEQLRARATTKEDVELGNLPNAISDDQDTNSSAILATTKAVKAATASIWTGIANIVSGVTVVGKAARLATTRKISVTGSVTGSADFDGSADVTFNLAAAQASESAAGSAKVASQPQVDEGLNDAAYVTPKKLRWGFLISLNDVGYIVFPTWLGGLIIQWGSLSAAVADGQSAVTFGIAFPNKVFGVNASFGYSSVRADYAITVESRVLTKTGFSANRQDIGSAQSLPTGVIYWQAFGF